MEHQTPEIIERNNDRSNICLLRLIDKDASNVCYDIKRNSLINKFAENDLEFILMDCCWGTPFKILNIFYTAAKYFIGSTDETPLKGMCYDILTKKLLDFSNIRSNELANILVFQFFVRRFDDYYDHSVYNILPQKPINSPSTLNI